MGAMYGLFAGAAILPISCYFAMGEVPVLIWGYSLGLVVSGFTWLCSALLERNP